MNFRFGQAARLLKPFGVLAETIRETDGSTPKAGTFQDAFSLYLLRKVATKIP
jgi:hypothetical protein